MMRCFFLLCVGCLVSGAAVGLPAVAEDRTWTDLSGDYQLQAEMVGLADGTVQLKKADGTVVKVPLSRLSSNDRLWIARNRRSVTSATASRSPDSTLVSATEWPRWRGPNNNGISAETDLLSQWPEGGPPLAWSSRGLGRGYSSIAISQGKLITMGKKPGGTRLICVSANDGSPVWELPIGGNKDPNCTPTVDPDSQTVFALTSEGVLVCANIETGREIWRKNFESDLGGRMMSGWGYSESPLVDGDRLICTPGSDRGVMAALDKRSGEVVWQTPMSGGAAGYSSPVISRGGGVKQYVTLVGKGLIGVRATDGKLLWTYPAIANSTANVPTPIVSGDYVFGSSGYNDGGSALLRLAPAPRGEVKYQEVYYKRNSDVQNHHGGMVLIGNHLFMGHGHNNGLPLCLDLRSGRTMWGPLRGPGKGSAAIVAADGHLYFRYEDGVMALIEATPKEYILKGTFAIKSNNGKSWPHPVIAGKKLFLRDQDELHCYDIAE